MPWLDTLLAKVDLPILLPVPLKRASLKKKKHKLACRSLRIGHMGFWVLLQMGWYLQAGGMTDLVHRRLVPVKATWFKQVGHGRPGCNVLRYWLWRLLYKDPGLSLWCFRVYCFLFHNLSPVLCSSLLGMQKSCPRLSLLFLPIFPTEFNPIIFCPLCYAFFCHLCPLFSLSQVFHHDLGR